MKKGFIDIEISKLKKAEWNYKEENDILTKKLLCNMQKNGQIENIIIRELKKDTFEVVNGNHRIDVMKILKNKKVHAFNLGKISLVEAQRIAIETNETKFGSNEIKLGNLISEISKEFEMTDLVESMPYSQDEINSMISINKFDWDEKNENEEVNEKFNNIIKLKVSDITFAQWEQLKARVEKIGGYASDSKVFEFAIIEALNIPEECLGVSE